MKGIHPFIVKGKKCGTVSEFVKPEHNQPSLDHISWNSRHASGQEKYRKNKWGHGPPHPPPFPTPNLCAAQTTSMQTPETQIPPTLVKHKIFKWRWNSHHPDSTSYLSKKTFKMAQKWRCCKLWFRLIALAFSLCEFYFRPQFRLNEFHSARVWSFEMQNDLVAKKFVFHQHKTSVQTSILNPKN